MGLNSYFKLIKVLLKNFGGKFSSDSLLLLVYIHKYSDIFLICLLSHILHYYFLYNLILLCNFLH